MKIRKIFLPATVALATLGFSSCLNTDGDGYNRGTVIYGNSDCFNHVTDLQTGESFTSANPLYTFNQDYTALTSTPSMSNIKLTENGSGLSFKLPELKVKTNVSGYTYTSQGTDLVPDGAAQSYLFNNFSFKYMDRYLRTSASQYIASPVFDISYTINNRYYVVAFPMSYDLMGSTTVTSEVETYTGTGTIFSIRLDYETKKASLTLTDAKFLSNSLTFYIAVRDLPYTVNPNGIVISTPTDEKLQARGQVGELKDCYFSDINLRLSVPSGKTTLSFKADLLGVNGEETSRTYEVTSSLSYSIPSDSSTN